MFIQSINLTKTLPCLAEPSKIIIIGETSSPIDEVIPYLATLPGVISYNPGTMALTIRRTHGFMTLYPKMVVITQVKDTEEGLELLKALTDAINATWEKRADLTAAFVVRHAPGWLDIWRLLPQTNCKECGEATCMAFAAALLKQTRRVDECAPLSADPTFVDRRVTLDTMV